MGLPRVLGEIVAGVFLGPVFLGMSTDTEVIRILSELGVFFLMFHAGLDTNPRELYRQAKISSLVCIGGVVPLFFLSYLILSTFQYSIFPALFMSAVLSLNSIPVIVSVFKRFNLQNDKIGHTVLGASVVNELLLFVIISVVMSLKHSEIFLWSDFLLVIAKVFFFFSGTLFMGQVVLPYFARFLNTIGGKGFTFALIVALIFGLFAEFIGLHIILGAYLGGMFVREQINQEVIFKKIEDRFFGISYSFMGPIFFAYVGMTISFEILWKHPLLFSLLFGIVILSQVIGSGYVAKLYGKFTTKDSFLVGTGMVGRGGTEIIVAGVGYNQGILPIELFSTVVLVAFLSTLFMSFSLMSLFGKKGNAP
jgi:Kef-type K+ transport system membrane component KefB